ncbi:hypothetical protein [Tropicimonas sp. IMCC6043]|uniref:hypothetical protein n=1 Tax=Tropicimonas sp. IMCC6043 TaxID=2510645 RepID=UPI00101C5DD4|nr:hypothetical protein [Tropicimonas sp. IMCC6043]RYH08048.1 hypothetical protein EU800_18165 [Tropicimonas sp. IMCC6043]
MSRNDTGSGGGSDRDARLKQALKANLARRKAQARARSAEDAADSTETGRDNAGEAERNG